MFVYPDTAQDWWTIVVEPSPYPDRGGEDYTHGRELIASILESMDVTWLERGETEAEIERTFFDRRPLLGPVDWLPELDR